MIPLAGLLVGFGVGWVRAGKRGGNRLDKLQYGAGHAIAFGILGVIVGIILHRSGLV